MLTTACGNCNIGDCPDQISVFATVNGPQAELLDANATLCRNAVCATGALIVGSGTSDAPVGMLTAPSFTVEVIANVGSDFTLVTFDYYSDGTIGGDTGYANGDFFHVTIVGSNGATMLDASGSATYMTRDSSCSSYVCHELDMGLN